MSFLGSPKNDSATALSRQLPARPQERRTSLARAQVDHHGQEEPPLAGAKVGDAARGLVGGHGAGEVAAHQVGARLGLGVGYGRALLGVGRAAAYPQLARQFQDPVARQVREIRRQHRVDEAEPEPAVGFKPNPH